MWLEGILSGDDLTDLVKKLTPLTIPLGEDGSIHLSDPSDVALLPDVGVRVVCKAELTWPVLGVRVPVVLHSIRVVLRPEVLKKPGADALVFKLELEHADVAGIPTIIDNHITERVNTELGEKHVELSWNFAETLSHVFELPATLEPLDAFDLRVAWGEVKVTREAMVFAVSFHSFVTRHAQGAARATRASRAFPDPIRETQRADAASPLRAPRSARSMAIAACVAVLALVGGGFVLGHALTPQKRAFW